ncbi:DUF4272 domain-containing protein [bacterium]|nr:MAG: DUF4272 domain-containing protein [bacterium]
MLRGSRRFYERGTPMAESFSKLKAEVARQWRLKYAEEMKKRGEPLPADFRESEPDDGKLAPPDARRVARRAAVLGTVALRGLASTWPHEDQVEFLPALLAWFAGSGLDDEIEPGEREILAAPASELDNQSAADATWRWEGAAVLVAALGRFALPPHDTVVDTEACGQACGLFAEPDDLKKLIDDAAFAPTFDRDAYANRALAISWRLRQFVHIEQKPIEFAKYAAGVEWATFDVRDVAMAGGDLSINGKPIARAAKSDLSTAMSIANERHQAANWLIGWHAVYGEVETPS